MMSLSVSSLGARRAQQDLQASAQRVATADQPGSGVNLADEAIDVSMSRNQFSASVASIKVQDEMMGTLLDVVA